MTLETSGTDGWLSGAARSSGASSSWAGAISGEWNAPPTGSRLAPTSATPTPVRTSGRCTRRSTRPGEAPSDSAEAVTDGLSFWKLASTLGPPQLLRHGEQEQGPPLAEGARVEFTDVALDAAD